MQLGGDTSFAMPQKLPTVMAQTDGQTDRQTGTRTTQTNRDPNNWLTD